MIYTALKKLNRLFGFMLPLLLFGCARIEQNQPVAADNSQNQTVNQIVTKPTPREKFERDKNLQAESDRLLPLFDNMPAVPVYLKDEPILKSGTNTEKGSAYTHCYESEKPAVFVKKIFYQKASRKRLVNALKHELTHAWLCRKRQMSGHDEQFRRKFKQVGGFGN
jgi:hypothetical protein